MVGMEFRKINRKGPELNFNVSAKLSTEQEAEMVAKHSYPKNILGYQQWGNTLELVKHATSGQVITRRMGKHLKGDR
jgi:hypothetical protein